MQMPIKGLFVHRVSLTEGSVAIDDAIFSQIDVDRREQIARAHTSTHMIHEVLREVLGREATQAGSENAPSRMRFDFRHSAQVSASDLSAIEAEVNRKLQENLAVTDQIMSLDEAKALGATALFGEKYGKDVRVVSIGGTGRVGYALARTSPTPARSVLSRSSASPRSALVCAAWKPSWAAEHMRKGPRSVRWSLSSAR